ncbi:MAG: hypothetical protein IKZ16_07720, partial [Clostridia bacterium]|nr:hypothetical protein [Clostridia bacterium]
PFLSLDEPKLREFLPKAKAVGLVGMETNYSTFSPEQTALAHDLVKEFDLKPGGGSDYHGTNKPDIRIGIGRGNLQVPYDYYPALMG